MNCFVEIVLGDGMVCLCPFEGQEEPCFGTVCIVTIDGVSEFGKFLRIQERSGGGNISYSGIFSHVAEEEELTKLAGNEEAAARARGMLMKWVGEERRTLYGLRLRFTVRRERLYLTLDVADAATFKSFFQTLEKRFQTQIFAQFITSRTLSGTIGGMGVCGCVLCCSNGICEGSRVEVKMAKQQLVPLHDSVAAGLCGRLKCCIAYEA